MLILIKIIKQNIFDNFNIDHIFNQIDPSVLRY